MRGIMKQKKIIQATKKKRAHMFHELKCSKNLVRMGRIKRG